jgi:hypothetical protein
MSFLTQWRSHDPSRPGERRPIASPLGKCGDGIVQRGRYIEPRFGLPGQTKSPCDPVSYQSFRKALPAPSSNPLRPWNSRRSRWFSPSERDFCAERKQLGLVGVVRKRCFDPTFYDAG